jgi:hypothetical protein
MNNPTMNYESEDEKWIRNRALEIHLMEQVPLPIARSEAMAERERMNRPSSAGETAVDGCEANSNEPGTAD